MFEQKNEKGKIFSKSIKLIAVAFVLTIVLSQLALTATALNAPAAQEQYVPNTIYPQPITTFNLENFDLQLGQNAILMHNGVKLAEIQITSIYAEGPNASLKLKAKSTNLLDNSVKEFSLSPGQEQELLNQSNDKTTQKTMLGVNSVSQNSVNFYWYQDIAQNPSPIRTIKLGENVSMSVAESVYVKGTNSYHQITFWGPECATSDCAGENPKAAKIEVTAFNNGNGSSSFYNLKLMKQK